MSMFLLQQREYRQWIILKLFIKYLKSLKVQWIVHEVDRSLLKAENFKITENRFENIIRMLAKEEYITGVIDMIGIQGIKFDDVRITLKGLEYLSEDSLMKKAANLAKSIKETIPGI